MKSRRLVVEAGRVQVLRRTGEGAIHVSIDRCRRRGRIDATVDVLFDCTGPAPNVTHATSSVLRGLLDSGLAMVDPSGLGLAADPLGRIAGADSRQSAIFGVGPLVRGAT